MGEHHSCDRCGACIKSDPTEKCCHEILIGGGDRQNEQGNFFDLCPKCSKKFFKLVDEFFPDWRSQ